jgi:hypothetical protein
MATAIFSIIYLGPEQEDKTGGSHGSFDANTLSLDAEIVHREIAQCLNKAQHREAVNDS